MRQRRAADSKLGVIEVYVRVRRYSDGGGGGGREAYAEQSLGHDLIDARSTAGTGEPDLRAGVLGPS